VLRVIGRDQGYSSQVFHPNRLMVFRYIVEIRERDAKVKPQQVFRASIDGRYWVFVYLSLLSWRTKRSSKNCAGVAFLASGTVSERKFKIPCIPGSEIIRSRRKPALR
jgi:hypothetical protein